MIPKIIHYCWFGGGEKPEIVKKCIASWRSILPDYLLIEWNETNFPGLTRNAFASLAYKTKKYAFITDVVRFWALYNFGGIYMDADVEVLRSLEPFMYNRAFTGHETKDLLVTAIMGAEPGHPWIRSILNYYNNLHPIEGIYEFKANTDEITRLSQPWVLGHTKDITMLREGVIIYPIDTFCPYDHRNLKPTPNENSYTVHHFAGTWLGRTK